MRAQFHLSGGFEVEVSNEPGGVRVTTFEGTCYEHPLHAAECKEVTVKSLSLSKGHARAVASAIMGCAAEA